ncbi:hypothetical protein LI90_496 [Carbonactinospora thermoautotrophica]|uniref:Uncharacterized protein n=1 Tax=Carbonactinospora thermoautotrophica TaxID=1469144 RepID=A0A132MLY8_9ACTN|nr:hypothetical protein LI90_496 [Carbonactinospora thermoautotrophica]
MWLVEERLWLRTPDETGCQVRDKDGQRCRQPAAWTLLALRPAETAAGAARLWSAACHDHLAVACHHLHDSVSAQARGLPHDESWVRVQPWKDCDPPGDAGRWTVLEALVG